MIFGYSEESPPTLGEFGNILRNRYVWIIGELEFLDYSLYLFVNSWESSSLTQEMGLSLELSELLVVMFPAIWIVARMSSGFFPDRSFSERRQSIVSGSFFVATPLIRGFTRPQSIPMLVGILVAAGFAIHLTLGLLFTYAQEVIDSRIAATAVAVQTSAGLAGAFVAPIAGDVVVTFLVASDLVACGVVMA